MRIPSEGQSFKFLDQEFEIKKSRGTRFKAISILKEPVDKKFKKLEGKKFTLMGTKFQIQSARFGDTNKGIRLNIEAVVGSK